ncbi:MAG: hypothetical protein HQ582_10960 [Planctomycetes bacterium]|nr:hypothetical protein [Planctomycetota bacterium]
MSVILCKSVEHISETYHPEAVASEGTVRYVSARVAITVFIAGAVLITPVSIAFRAPILTGLGLYAFIAGPICLAAILSRIRQVSQVAERTILLDNGNITVRTSTETESYPVGTCCWFRGKATDDSHLSYQPIRRKVIVIVFPTGRTVACGLDDSFYSRWLNAVRSNQCRRVLRQEGALGMLFFMLVIIGLIAGGFIGWRLGGELQSVLIPQPANNQFANLIPAVFAILLAWLFAISPWFIPGWRRHTTRERQQFTRSAILFPVKLAIPAGAVLGGNLAVGIGLAAAFAVLFLVITRFVTHAPASVVTHNAA